MQLHQGDSEFVVSPGLRCPHSKDALVSFGVGGIKRAALIVNTRSRTGESAFLKAHERLRALGVPLGATYAVHDPAQVRHWRA